MSSSDLFDCSRSRAGTAIRFTRVTPLAVAEGSSVLVCGPRSLFRRDDDDDDDDGACLSKTRWKRRMRKTEGRTNSMNKRKLAPPHQTERTDYSGYLLSCARSRQSRGKWRQAAQKSRYSFAQTDICSMREAFFLPAQRMCDRSFAKKLAVDPSILSTESPFPSFLPFGT